MTRQEWLETLCEGAEVRIRYFAGEDAKGIVVSVTANTLAVRYDGGKRTFPYSKIHNGFFCANGSYDSYLAPLTELENKNVRYTPQEQLFYNLRKLLFTVHSLDPREAKKLSEVLKKENFWSKPEKFSKLKIE